MQMQIIKYSQLKTSSRQSEKESRKSKQDMGEGYGGRWDLIYPEVPGACLTNCLQRQCEWVQIRLVTAKLIQLMNNYMEI